MKGPYGGFLIPTYFYIQTDVKSQKKLTNTLNFL